MMELLCFTHCYFSNKFSLIFFQLRGMYMTRQLSFAGVSFDVKELPLSKDFTDMYDASVKLVSDTALFPVIDLSAVLRYFCSDFMILCLVKSSDHCPKCLINVF